MKQLLKKIAAIIKDHASWPFKIGLFLLLINPVIGLVISPLLVLIFSRLYDIKTGVMVGSGVYIFSWGLLGLGVLFSGKDGYRISKQVFREIKLYIKGKSSDSSSE